MRLIKPSHEIIGANNLEQAFASIEQAGKTCYGKQGESSTMADRQRFIRGLVVRGHHSVLEHASFSVRFICDRGVSHELVRHRLAAISQESTRFCRYKENLTFVIPSWLNIEPGVYQQVAHWADEETRWWATSMLNAEMVYLELLDTFQWTPQQARAVLPNSLKTELVITANIREWRHILSLRAVGTAGTPHPQMLELMEPLLAELVDRAPALFGDLRTAKEMKNE